MSRASHSPKDTEHFPLHIKVRPQNLEEFIGQSHIIDKRKPLWQLLGQGKIYSLILYGPAGTGKTTFALCLKNYINSEFVLVNGASSTLEDLKREINKAKDFFRMYHKKTILFVDEIHHFNKRQQDIFLPVLEEGYLVLVGATIHNPFFYIIPPLISRSQVLEFKPFSEEEIKKIVKRAKDLFKPEGVKILPDTLKIIAHLSDGDARRALNLLEMSLEVASIKKSGKLTPGMVKEVGSKKSVVYDRDEDEHYDTISAFIKSVRGSDPDAAIYYLSKMLYAGEDPLFIVRRLIILASEDIGNADPFALVLAASAQQAVHFVGLPEAELVLAQVTLYLACASKSNASYLALKDSKADIENERTKETPSYLRDANYQGAQKLGRGQGYKYSHSFQDPRKVQEYLKKAKKYYRPKDAGYEKKIKERLK